MSDRQDITQSLIFATSERRITKYGERLLMEVISAAKEYTLDAALGLGKLKFDEEFNEKFAMVDVPIRSVLDLDDASNYTAAKNAALVLMNTNHVVEEPVFDSDGNQKTYSDGRPQYKLAASHIVEKVWVNEKPGIITVKLGIDTWKRVLDMGKGYTRYDLLDAKRLNNVVAIRLFQLLSNRPEVSFELDALKKMLGVQDKYRGNLSAFESRVILPAEEEINANCEFEVRHEPIHTKREGISGRPAVTGFRFIKVPKAARVNVNDILDEGTRNFLTSVMKFTAAGLNNNIKLLVALKEAGYDIVGYLRSILGTVQKATNPQGYAVTCLKKLLEDGPDAESFNASLRAAQAPEAPAQPSAPAGRPSGRRSGKTPRLSVSDTPQYTSDDIEEL